MSAGKPSPYEVPKPLLNTNAEPSENSGSSYDNHQLGFPTDSDEETQITLQKDQSANQQQPEKYTKGGVQSKRPDDFESKHTSDGDEALAKAHDVRESLNTLSFLLDLVKNTVLVRSEKGEKFTQSEALGFINALIDCHTALTKHLDPEGKNLLEIYAESHPNSSLHPQDIYQIETNSPQLLAEMRGQKEAIEKLKPETTFPPSFIGNIEFHSRDILGGALSPDTNQSSPFEREGEAAVRDHTKTLAAHQSRGVPDFGAKTRHPGLNGKGFLRQNSGSQDASL